MYKNFFITLFLLCVTTFIFFILDKNQGVTWFPEVPNSASIDNINHEKIFQLIQIQKSLITGYWQISEMPLPDNYIKVFYWGNLIWFQWKLWINFLNFSQITNDTTWLKDSYYFLSNNWDFKIFTYLESFLGSNGAFNNKPIYSIQKWTANFILNNQWEIFLGPKIKEIDLSNISSLKNLNIMPPRNCRDIKNLYPSSKSGTFSILDYDDKIRKIYCDMEIDNGGWTLFYANNNHPDSKIKKSFTNLRDDAWIKKTNDVANYLDKFLSWLYNYDNIEKNWFREILFWSLEVPRNQWYKISFSTPSALKWALWPSVLWKTEETCIALPGDNTWELSNFDNKETYKNLRYIMNLGGSSWWISHLRYPCNGYIWYKNSIIGFYVAWSSQDGLRVRSFLNLNAEEKLETYRYFVR